MVVKLELVETNGYTAKLLLQGWLVGLGGLEKLAINDKAIPVQLGLSFATSQVTSLIGESLGLEIKSTKTLGLFQVLYKIWRLSRMKKFQTVSSHLLQFF